MGSQPSPAATKPVAHRSGGMPAGWQLPSSSPSVPAGQPLSWTPGAKHRPSPVRRLGGRQWSSGAGTVGSVSVPPQPLPRASATSGARCSHRGTGTVSSGYPIGTPSSRGHRWRAGRPWVAVVTVGRPWKPHRPGGGGSGPSRHGLSLHRAAHHPREGAGLPRQALARPRPPIAQRDGRHTRPRQAAVHSPGEVVAQGPGTWLNPGTGATAARSAARARCSRRHSRRWRRRSRRSLRRS